VIRQRVKQAIFEIAILSILIDYCQLPNVMSEFRTSYIIITNILLSRIYYYHEYIIITNMSRGNSYCSLIQVSAGRGAAHCCH
jgi:hypothetical protein